MPNLYLHATTTACDQLTKRSFSGIIKWVIKVNQGQQGPNLMHDGGPTFDVQLLNYCLFLNEWKNMTIGTIPGADALLASIFFYQSCFFQKKYVTISKH